MKHVKKLSVVAALALMAGCSMRPEGVILYHTAAGQAFKVLCEDDDISKSQAGARRA